MTRATVARRAAIALPLWLAALILTCMPPETAHPMVMALVPLGWAAAVAIVMGSDSAVAAYAVALPFSAYAAVAFAAAPYAMLAAVWTSAAASAATASLASGTMSAGAAGAAGRIRHAAALVAGWIPGCAAAIFAGPWSGAAVALLTALAALYARARRMR